MLIRPTLSAALIVKNEAAQLRQCLATVADWVDEIIIVDSGSTDETLSIAQAFKAKIYSHTEWAGFGHQRQLAQQYVTSDWVLWLDADERVTPELSAEIQQQLLSALPITAFALPRLSWAFGRFIYHSGWYPGYVVRLYPVELTHYDDALVHEKVLVHDGMRVQRLKGNLLHYTYRDVSQYLNKMAHYSSLWAQQRQAKGKTTHISTAIGHAFATFLKMYVIKRGFLDGKQGFILAVANAYATFTKYADLWIRTHTQEPDTHEPV